MKFTPQAIEQATAVLDDFAFEVRVKKLLQDHCSEVQHGWTYHDPVEDKPRQFDLRALLRHPHGFRRPCTLRLAVECKNIAAESPLFISGTSRHGSEAFHDIICSNPMTKNGRPQQYILRTDPGSGVYKINEFVGKNLLRMEFKDGKLVKTGSQLDKDIYLGWSQALASAYELCFNALQREGPNDDVERSTCVVPVVVVPDDRMWILHYGEADGLVAPPYAANETTVFFHHVVDLIQTRLTLSHVHFMTYSGLRKFLANHAGGWFPWESWFTTESHG